ncbi:MAG TPA: hypothetical protein DEP87_03775, partial [Candidatus Pacebacteria bacterium]|nr:hypothetical protein [Candidatus Paceibacterota bacterium]
SVPKPASLVDSSEATPDQESLEAQNIFELLGASKGSDAEKEAFLDELQQVIWEDFVANDIPLLLTHDELAQVQEIQAKTTDLAKQQEEIVTFLEKLIPDLEDIMLEKALELKREMVNERLAGLRTHLAGQTDKLAKLNEAEQAMYQHKWRSVAQKLNALS